MINDLCKQSNIIRQLGNISTHLFSVRENPNRGRVYDIFYICPTINQMCVNGGGGGLQPHIIEVVMINSNGK